ncbi:MAG: hypothetical protein K2O18_08400 [Oscillospiraceae bacterium]|nr:hypothetical protein [Oscillospiraceae bacterium]
MKDRVEDAFGMDAEERILRFLLEKELADSSDDTLRWLGLFEKCEQWRKQFLLWEDSTYINGINGWNLSIGVYKLHLPESDDWTIYLYHMTLLAVVSGMRIGERTSLAEAGRKYHNFSAVAGDYYVNSGYVSLTREQWLEELTGLLKQSWENYQKFPGTSPVYHREMKENYPKFNSILEHLAQDIKNCEAVRMNQYGGDETIWYFVKTSNCFYLISMNDSM